MSRKSQYDRLDLILTSIEESISRDDESDVEHSHTSDIKLLLKHQIEKYERSRPAANSGLRIVPNGKSSKKNANSSKDFSERLRMLSSLLSARPELSPRMSSTFSSGAKPSAREVDELLEELFIKGVLKKHDRN